MEGYSPGIEALPIQNATDVFLESLAAPSQNEKEKLKAIYGDTYRELKSLLTDGGLIAGDGTVLAAHGDMNTLGLPLSMQTELTKRTVMHVPGSQLPYEWKEAHHMNQNNGVKVVLLQPGSIDHLTVATSPNGSPAISFAIPHTRGTYDAFEQQIKARLEKSAKAANLQLATTPHATIRSMLVHLHQEHAATRPTPAQR